MLDIKRLNELLKMQSSATDPSRDHELAAMVPELVKMAKLEINELSLDAKTLLERLKMLSSDWMHSIYLDELPAANELVKAGLATFPRDEVRYDYSKNIKYLKVGLGRWDEGTLDPLTDEELYPIRHVLEFGSSFANNRRLVDANVLALMPDGSVKFSDCALKLHQRPFEPKQYRMMVRASGPKIRFANVPNTHYFIRNGMLMVKNWAGVGISAIVDGVNNVKRSDLPNDTLVQPVTVTWE